MDCKSFNHKEDYIQSLIEACKPLKAYYSEGKARLNLGCSGTHYDKQTMELEAFARPLWGLVPLWAGSDQNDFKDSYQEGIKNGVNKEHKEYWGKLTDHHQAFVEMATMGLGLLITPESIWYTLDAETKESFNEWLLQINEYKYSDNNWKFFGIIVNTGLKNVGARYSEEAIDEAFEKIEECYLGEGWYSDGKSDQRDYYIAFAMHFYSLIYAKVMKEADRERSEKFIKRAEIFAQDFIYWFAENGEALPYGRSLTYRFAQCCFFSALAFADVEVFSWGVMKGIVNRHFRSWWNKPIFDKEGILTIGYDYPNLNMAEGYNAPGSPYWAFKSFLILALDEQHPFWKAEEEELPKLDKIKVLKHPRMIIQRVEKDHIIALASGQYVNFEPNHTAEKYAKFAYSNYFGFNLPKSYYLLDKAVPDNMLAFERENMYYVRRKCEAVKITGDSIYSKWSPLSGVSVETELKPYKSGHLRTHTIQADFDIKAVECGFAMPDDHYPVENGICGEGHAIIQNEKGYSHIELLQGEGKGDILLCEANTNLVHPRVIMPYINLSIKKGTTVIQVYVVGLKTKIQ